MTKSSRIGPDGYPEHEFAFIREIDGALKEDTFWSPFRYPSNIRRIYVRADDPENLEIKRAQVRRQIEDRKNERFLEQLTPADAVAEPMVEAPSNVVQMLIKKPSTIFQRSAPRS